MTPASNSSSSAGFNPNETGMHFEKPSSFGASHSGEGSEVGAMLKANTSLEASSVPTALFNTTIAKPQTPVPSRSFSSSSDSLDASGPKERTPVQKTVPRETFLFSTTMIELETLFNNAQLVAPEEPRKKSNSQVLTQVLRDSDLTKEEQMVALQRVAAFATTQNAALKSNAIAHAVGKGLGLDRQLTVKAFAAQEYAYRYLKSALDHECEKVKSTMTKSNMAQTDSFDDTGSSEESLPLTTAMIDAALQPLDRSGKLKVLQTLIGAFPNMSQGINNPYTRAVAHLSETLADLQDPRNQEHFAFTVEGTQQDAGSDSEDQSWDVDAGPQSSWISTAFSRAFPPRSAGDPTISMSEAPVPIQVSGPVLDDWVVDIETWQTDSLVLPQTTNTRDMATGAADIPVPPTPPKTTTLVSKNRYQSAIVALEGLFNGEQLVRPGCPNRKEDSVAVTIAIAKYRKTLRLDLTAEIAIYKAVAQFQPTPKAKGKALLTGGALERQTEVIAFSGAVGDLLEAMQNGTMTYDMATTTVKVLSSHSLQKVVLETVFGCGQDSKPQHVQDYIAKGDSEEQVVRFIGAYYASNAQDGNYTPQQQRSSLLSSVSSFGSKWFSKK